MCSCKTDTVSKKVDSKQEKKSEKKEGSAFKETVPVERREFQ